MTVVDDLSSEDSPTTAQMFLTETLGGGLESFVLQAVKADPFMTIGEIRREYARRDSGKPASWLRVFRILRRHGILRKRSRFRYAWGR